VPHIWQVSMAAKIVSLGGILLAMGGLTLAFLYERPMTWARATLGAWLFTGLALIVFGIIPNEWLTLTQSTLEWTPQKIFLPLPRWLVLHNDVAISAAALKDMISGGYAVVALVAMAVAMYRWQERAKRAKVPKPTPVSEYGRPLRTER